MAETTELRGSGSPAVERLDLRSLSRWINGSLLSNAPVRRSAYAAEDRHVLELAERSDVLQPAGLASEINCDFCDEPHACRVIRADGCYRYLCLLNGWVEVAEEDLTLLAFNRERLLASLAQTAGGQPRTIKTFARDQLTRLAFVELSSSRPNWVFAYADKLEDENVQAGVIESLATEFPDGPGLIATPSAVPMNLPLPRRYSLIALHDLVFGYGHEFAIDYEVAGTRLDRRQKTTGRPGRPTEQEAIRELWSQLRTSQNWPQ